MPGQIESRKIIETKHIREGQEKRQKARAQGEHKRDMPKARTAEGNTNGANGANET